MKLQIDIINFVSQTVTYEVVTDTGITVIGPNTAPIPDGANSFADIKAAAVSAARAVGAALRNDLKSRYDDLTDIGTAPL